MNTTNDPMSVRVHGTYPWDDLTQDHKSRWKRIQDLGWQEAAKLTGVIAPDRADTCTGCRGSKKAHTLGGFSYACPSCDGTGEFGVYLWLNKGFIVLDLPREHGAPSNSITLLMMEQFTSGSPQVLGIKTGMRAVYLHDGHYSLIERL